MGGRKRVGWSGGWRILSLTRGGKGARDYKGVRENLVGSKIGFEGGLAGSGLWLVHGEAWRGVASGWRLWECVERAPGVLWRCRWPGFSGTALLVRPGRRNVMMRPYVAPVLLPVTGKHQAAPPSHDFLPRLASLCPPQPLLSEPSAAGHSNHGLILTCFPPAPAV